MQFLRRMGPVQVQCTIVLALLATLIMMPPTSGPMLVIPFGRVPQGRLVNVALDGSGRILGPGPLRGSLVVLGRRSALAPGFRRVGALVLAAPAIACGNLGSEDAA